jgi:hypothetical protein
MNATQLVRSDISRFETPLVKYDRGEKEPFMVVYRTNSYKGIVHSAVVLYDR